MKSVIVLSVAGIGVARSPVGMPGRAPAAVPSVLAMPLLPWRQPSRAANRCGGPVGYLDILCGTQMYCEAFTHARVKISGPGPRFNTTDECFRAHRPRSAPGEKPAAPGPAPLSLPWTQNGSKVEQCGLGVGFITDRNCGTRRYCDAHDTLGLTRTDLVFATTYDCLLAHEEDPYGSEAPPAAEPWVEPADPEAMCGIYCYDEKECGTARYCWAFDNDREFTDGAFRSEEHCRAHRRKPPPDAAPLKTKLAWKHPSAAASSCDEDRFWDLQKCGTRLFCDAFDQYSNETLGRFRTATDCYMAFEKNPMVVQV